MSLEKCPDCGTEVSSSAPTCPNCGARLRKSDLVTALLVLFGCVAAPLVAMLIYGLSIPKHEAQARKAHEVCERMYKDGQIPSILPCQAMRP